MKKRLLSLVLIALLSGCGQSLPPTTEPVEEVASQTVLPAVEPEPEPEPVPEPEPEPAPEPEPIEYHYVALTFDDGPSPQTPHLLDELAARGVKATFFCLGLQADKYPQTLQRIVDEGHQLANHSYSHLNMTKVKESVWQADFQKAEDSFNAILGTDDQYWLRLPYGLINRNQYANIDVPMVLWSVDPRDWDLLDAQAVTTAVVDTVAPYDIILLHDTYETSVEAALAIIDQLEEENYRFVTVEELLALGGITPEVGVIYRAASGANNTIWRGNNTAK